MTELQDVLSCYTEVQGWICICERNDWRDTHESWSISPIFQDAECSECLMREGRAGSQMTRMRLPVQFMNWAAPIVRVVKQHGTVRICGNYKVTVNRAMEIDTYHLPQFKDLFALLSQGKIFSKLDQVGCISTNCTVWRIQTVTNTHKGLYIYNRLPFVPEGYSKLYCSSRQRWSQCSGRLICSLCPCNISKNRDWRYFDLRRDRGDTPRDTGWSSIQTAP